MILQGFSQVQLNAVEDNTQFVQQREQELDKITRSIQDLNEIFKDLATMIVDQVGSDLATMIVDQVGKLNKDLATVIGRQIKQTFWQQ